MNTRHNTETFSWNRLFALPLFMFILFIQSCFNVSYLISLTVTVTHNHFTCISYSLFSMILSDKKPPLVTCLVDLYRYAKSADSFFGVIISSSHLLTSKYFPHLISCVWCMMNSYHVAVSLLSYYKCVVCDEHELPLLLQSVELLQMCGVWWTWTHVPLLLQSVELFHTSPRVMVMTSCHITVTVCWAFYACDVWWPRFILPLQPVSCTFSWNYCKNEKLPRLLMQYTLMICILW